MKKYIPLLFSLCLTFVLNTQWGILPPLGKFLSPFSGCWESAKAENETKIVYTFTALQKPVEVRFDKRLVPHIFAANEHDAFFIQGYLHAKFRLWQMDMTTRLASGRLSEVAGSKALPSDREMRRKGMVFGAENSLQTIEKDKATMAVLNAYRDGVNELIESLAYKNYPLEYKLMNFEPEAWTNLKTCLMMKFMADKLSGVTEDFELSAAKQILGDEQFTILYPEHLEEEYPVIATPQIKKPESCIDSAIETLSFIHSPKNVKQNGDDDQSGIGSNNWAVAGSKTKSGKPILCNDPHLPLNLPSIWYENQIHTPTINVYGVSLPGAPSIVIGFNDSIAWGFTNGYRDVKDFYKIQFTDSSRKFFSVDGKYMKTTRKIERFTIKGETDFYDTVLYCQYGPVMYDTQFPRKGFEQQNFAVQWMGHKGSNEIKTLLYFNKANNYNDFVTALAYFECPHQNFVFSSASGDIAMWSHGKFINKQYQQGRFIEDGNKQSSNWGDAIPYLENPHETNPDRGYVLSANQVNTTNEYIYYYNGIFSEERAKRLHNLLSQNHKMDVREIMDFQQDTYWQDAADILPTLLHYIQTENLDDLSKRYVHALQTWDYYATAKSKEAVMFDMWFDEIEHALYDDEFGTSIGYVKFPKVRVTHSIIKNNKQAYTIDDHRTSKQESISDIINVSFQNMYKKLNPRLDWYRYKQTSATHLAKLPAFSFQNIKIGGGHGMVNAASTKDGPSWRMIVHFTHPIEAYGIYHAGQSGNPGSKFYANMLNDWAEGKYYRLLFAHQPNDIP
ncbi:MAG: penicillin acylase family protein [Bacteroidetes bacterium]|nr:penicillin acylase family protein [Bacteroidota bacterium]